MCQKRQTSNTVYKIFNSSGFTLLELTVSIFIIAIMSALFLTNYNTGNSSNALSLSAQEMGSNIRMAQNKALGSVPYNSGFPTGGWGVYFDTTAGNNTSYILFADINNNRIYDSGEGLESKGGQIYSLPANVVVSSIATNDLARPSPTSLNTTFIPPDPTTRIYDGLNTTTAATITLKETTTNRTANITINVLGLIQAK